MVEGLVSVIVPAHNAEPFIGEALDSAFAQDYRPLEVIVVDDGSTDRTGEIASAYDVQLLRQSNRGPSAARNAGLRLARGEYVALLDADDVWPEHRVSLLVAALGGEHGIAVGLNEVFVTPGQSAPAHTPQQTGTFHLPALIARRSVFDLVGGFDEELWLSDDVDWFMRARDAGIKLARVDQVVVRYRIHARNTSRDRTEAQATMLRALRSSIARRREQVGWTGL